MRSIVLLWESCTAVPGTFPNAHLMTSRPRGKRAVREHVWSGDCSVPSSVAQWPPDTHIRPSSARASYGEEPKSDAKKTYSLSWCFVLLWLGVLGPDHR
ncbi:hypothetical protein BJX63DRAFT_393971 [Aspergillus granulosus]|uniref:Uncharacterized protein n=1 Tax=Aspergillus granulosus TaxID=176169 RepID=A0ABR4HG65_9EURO